MQNMQEYKCPCCGGAIAFDSTIQKMKCPYCDSEFEMETLQAMDEQLKEGKSDRWTEYLGLPVLRWRNRRRCNDGGNQVSVL